MSSLIIPPILTSPQDDAAQLHKAFKGFGCDSGAVVNILAHRDATQRSLIQREYKAMYHKDLIKHLKSELSGNLEKAVLLWMHDPATRDAVIVKEALCGEPIHLRRATEVLCSRTSTQIQHLRQIYLSMFQSYIEHDIEKSASGDHKKLLLAYVSKPRYEGPEIDRILVEKDAKALYNAGEKRWGTDEQKFIKIFSESSRAHLAAVAYTYKQSYANSLEKAIKSETSGHFEYGLLTIVRCAENPAFYFAKVLHKAMKGMGTDDSTLIRIIVTRTEMDMQYIKIEYQKKYKKTLHDAVHSETSGSYRDFLLSLLG
ncbi:annexin D5-like [Cucumis melo]|uniref:Annexin n=1 Tax=Cucumis melo TaxID=3656 RepID=A0A1S3BYX0_CUCME|nr:annexin D5-like [Cucumis melo]